MKNCKINPILDFKDSKKFVEKIEAIHTNLKTQQQRKAFIDSKIPPQLLKLIISLCPNGDGSLYEIFVRKALSLVFNSIIDETLIQTQRPVTGGFIDIVLPFCRESLIKHSYWNSFAEFYRITGIIVEVKNLCEKAKVEHVNQIVTYINNDELGHFGIIISRNGFTKNAIQCLREQTKKNILILPLDQKDIGALLDLSGGDPSEIFRYLCKIERQLTFSTKKQSIPSSLQSTESKFFNQIIESLLKENN